MSKTVLILSASAGAGHLRAAQAIERAFAETGSAESVHNHDTLEFTNPLFRRLYSKTYIEMVNRMPEVLGWLYDRLDQPDQDDRLQLAFDKLNTGPLIKLLERLQPGHHDLHPLPARRDHLLAHRQGTARDAAGDRRHRLRRPCPVALPELRPLLRRDRRDPRPPGGARGPAGEGHGLRHPDRPGLRPARRTSSRCARSTGCGATGR